jgi:predicted nucleic acid-binding protein
MKIAYVDTSAFVAIAFGERGGVATARWLGEHDELFSANLLEAELRATYAREGVVGDDEILDAVSWVLPDRPLSEEIAAVLAAGYVRGADLWHLACALFLVGEPTLASFVTLDKRQQGIAATLGFRTRR